MSYRDSLEWQRTTSRILKRDHRQCRSCNQARATHVLQAGRGDEHHFSLCWRCYEAAITTVTGAKRPHEEIVEWAKVLKRPKKLTKAERRKRRPSRRVTLSMDVIRERSKEYAERPTRLTRRQMRRRGDIE